MKYFHDFRDNHRVFFPHFRVDIVDVPFSHKPLNSVLRMGELKYPGKCYVLFSGIEPVSLKRLFVWLVHFSKNRSPFYSKTPFFQ